MAFVPGQPKIGGRQKGTLNGSTVELLTKLKELNFDPVDELIKLYREGRDPAQKQKIASTLIDYVYPKRKAVEVTDLTDREKQLTPEEIQEIVKEIDSLKK